MEILKNKKVLILIAVIAIAIIVGIVIYNNVNALVKKIKPEDYGKSINYSVTLKDKDGNKVTLSDWEVYYSDGKNVYIILKDYLPTSLIPEEASMTRSNQYATAWENINSNLDAANKLKDTKIWANFAKGKGGDTATGSTTYRMFVDSWNANPATVETDLTNGKYLNKLSDPTGLYLISEKEDAYGYWFASADVAGSDENIWTIGSDGYIDAFSMTHSGLGLRPVVCLSSGVTGNVEDTVKI